jgi:diguanylate cyclase (GGDEF)-like protein
MPAASTRPIVVTPHVVLDRPDLRREVARTLEARAPAIVGDAIGSLPAATADPESVERFRELGRLLLATLAVAIVGDRDAQSSVVGETWRQSGDRDVGVPQLFGLAYVIERAALDELALHDTVGPMSEDWPAIAQTVRRASVAVLASLAERIGQDAAGGAVTEPLTALHTRAVLLAAIEKEVHRAARGSHPFAVIAFDVDRMTHINAAHGRRLGDRLIERIGFVFRTYFREQDWVCRTDGDRFAVLLPEISGAHAHKLAEGMRATVQERLSLRDYRTDEPVPVTMSGAVLALESIEAAIRAEDLLRDIDAALDRAKDLGGDRVETVLP